MTTPKTAIYQETIEADELYTYAINTREFWVDLVQNVVIPNLEKKVAKNTYNHEKALAWLYKLANTAAKMYIREFCSTGYRFLVNDKYTAACDMLEYIETDYLKIKE